MVRGYHRQFSVKVWCGIVDNHVLGQHVLPPWLTSPVYRQFVEHELPGLLHEDVSLATRNSMWFMHDGAPAHFSHVAREYLDVAYPNRCMGHAGPVAWPLRSPDLTSLKFYILECLKTLVYATEILKVAVLQQRIENSCAEVRNDVNGVCNIP